MRPIVVWLAIMLVLMVGCPDRSDASDSGARVGDGYSSAGLRASRAMPCQEDEALVWVDVPHVVACVNLEEL